MHGTSLAQNEPAIAGTVRGPDGAAMGGVTVTATQANSTITTTVTTDDAGRYAFPADRLPPATMR